MLTLQFVGQTVAGARGLITDIDIGARIRDARLSSGFQTGTAFAKALGIPQSTLSRIETGERRVSASELAAIAALLHKSPNDFLSESAGQVFYRRDGLGELSPDATEAFDWLRGFSERLQVLREYSQELELPKPYEILTRAPSTFEEARAAAYEVRQFLGLGTAPAPDMFALLERVGCAVLAHEFGVDEFEAMYVPEPLGVVLLNGSKPGVRQRFTLGHELAHHLFHREGVVVDADLFGTSWQLDRIANAFAAHFLMPSEGIEVELSRRFGLLRPTSAEHAYWLAYHFGVSLDAICFQLQNVQFANARASGQWRRANRRALAAMLKLVADEQYRAVQSRWPPEFVQRLGYLLKSEVLSPKELAAHLRNPKGESDVELVQAIVAESNTSEKEPALAR
jgi:Zn-dependent peptidase ImmA (M78 family)